MLFALQFWAQLQQFSISSVNCRSVTATSQPITRRYANVQVDYIFSCFLISLSFLAISASFLYTCALQISPLSEQIDFFFFLVTKQIIIASTTGLSF